MVCGWSHFETGKGRQKTKEQTEIGMVFTDFKTLYRKAKKKRPWLSLLVN
jgi:hypothetical protein